MSELIVYGHPFSSYTQKALMAFYEKGVACDFRVLAPDNQAGAEFQALWPIGKFPVLVADGVTLPESSVIIEWLDRRIPGPAPLIPTDPDLASCCDRA